MKRLPCILLLVSAVFTVRGQSDATNRQPVNVTQLWGTVFGKADTENDFLIYDACVSDYDGFLYMVGMANGNNPIPVLERPGAFFHAQDSLTDAFLACFSAEGRLEWSTFLPALEDGYMNGFATKITCTADGHLIVAGQAYRIEQNTVRTRAKAPLLPGKIFLFEFDRNGALYRNKMLSVAYQNAAGESTEGFLPRIFSWDLDSYSAHYFSGHYLADSTHSYPCYFRLDSAWRQDTVKSKLQSSGYDSDPKMFYWISIKKSTGYITVFDPMYERNIFGNAMFYEYDPSGAPRNIRTGLTIFEMYPPWQKNKRNRKNRLAYTPIRKTLPVSKDEVEKETSAVMESEVYSRGKDNIDIPLFVEKWEFVSIHSQGILSYCYADPKWTSLSWNSNPDRFSGTVQNIRSVKDLLIIQGMHCREYENGFFQKEQHPYAYSHDSSFLFSPPVFGDYHSRPISHTATPFLLAVDTTLKQSIALGTPGWHSFIDADWLYEDFFHSLNTRKNPQDFYMPYEPVLCSAGKRFFLIGNARTIGTSMLRSFDRDTYEGFPSDPAARHQGLLLAFQTGCSPTDTVELLTSGFLCPNDSVELLLPEELQDYYLFVRNPALTEDSIIRISPDSTRVFALAEGRYAFRLKSTLVGCPDIKTDTVEVKGSPYPEPLRGLPRDTINLCMNASVTLQAVHTPDSSFSYRWSSGEETPEILISFHGDTLLTAGVEVRGYCTAWSDSAVVRYLPPYVDLGKDTLVCHRYDTPPADTTSLLHLDAGRWNIRQLPLYYDWRINGRPTGSDPDLRIRYGDLERHPEGGKTATVMISIRLADSLAGSCTAYDTLHLRYFDYDNSGKNRFLPEDTMLCAHLDLPLFLPEEAAAYECLWKDRNGTVLPGGSDTCCLTIAGLHGTDGYGAGTDSRIPRLFQLQLDHRFCGWNATDSIRIFDIVKPYLQLPFHDMLLCHEQTVDLDWSRPLVCDSFYRYTWNSEEKMPPYRLETTGMNILEFSVIDRLDSVCLYPAATDTIRVLKPDPVLTLTQLPADTIFCRNLSVVLDASVPFVSTRYSWRKGYEDEFLPLFDTVTYTPAWIEISEEGDYTVFLQDSAGCVGLAHVQVREDECKPILDIPNVFTPNGDGVNDILKFKQLEMCFDLDILIVDRKGQHVLKEKVRTAEDFSWNGCLHNGSKKLPDGPYFYMISYKDAYGKKKIQSGSITILGSGE